MTANETKRSHIKIQTIRGGAFRDDAKLQAQMAGAQVEGAEL